MQVQLSAGAASAERNNFFQDIFSFVENYFQLNSRTYQEWDFQDRIISDFNVFFLISVSDRNALEMHKGLFVIGAERG